MSTPPSAPDPFAAPEPGALSGGPGDGARTPSGPPSYPSSLPGAPAYPGAPGLGAAPAGAPTWAGSSTQANSLAIWSLVLAVLGWVCFGLLTSIPAIVVGARAKRAADQGRADNRGMATAGIVLGWIGTALNGLVLVVVLVLVATRGWDGFIELLEEYGALTTP